MKNTTTKRQAFALPHWGPYTNQQRQLLTLWKLFERLCNEGAVTWARKEGNPFEPNGNGALEAGIANRNAVFCFTVKGGKVVRGVMF